MATVSESLAKPPAPHTRDLEAGNAHAEPNPAACNPDHKRSLKTCTDVRTEWQTGSRKRVIRHYAISLLVGLLVGGIVEMAVGLATRYTVGKQ
jgi:Flp pilus assembly protein TadB